MPSKPTLTVSQLHARLGHLMALAPDAYVILNIPHDDYGVASRLESADITVSPNLEDHGMVTLTAEAV